MSIEHHTPSDFFKITEKLMDLIKQCESQAAYLQGGKPSREGAVIFTKIQEARLWLSELVEKTPAVSPDNACCPENQHQPVPSPHAYP